MNHRQVKDNSLAPKTWDTYLGQEKVKRRLQVQIQGALKRFENLKHTLILGDPGFGKTTLAELIAQEMGQDLLQVMMTPDFKTNKLNGLIASFEGGIFFMDEIHNLSAKGQHYLFDVMEKNKITYDDGSYQYLEVPITFVAATTEQEKIVKPLYGRFTNKHFLEPYTDAEMADIVEKMCNRAGVPHTRELCIALGKAAGGTPRQARALVFAAQDLGNQDLEEILDLCGVTPEGLTEDHLSYLKAINDLGDTAGLDNIATHSRRPKKIIEDLEKMMIDRRYITIGKGGRSLTWDGQKVLKNNKDRL